MKHKDLLGITVDELINNYVHVYIDQDGDYGYYIGIMDLKDAQKLPSKYLLKDIIDDILLADLLNGTVLDLGDLDD